MIPIAEVLLPQFGQQAPIFFGLFPQAQHHLEEYAVDVGHLGEDEAVVLVEAEEVVELVDFPLVVDGRGIGHVSCGLVDQVRLQALQLLQSPQATPLLQLPRKDLLDLAQLVLREVLE